MYECIIYNSGGLIKHLRITWGPAPPRDLAWGLPQSGPVLMQYCS